jgi:hypothetical protein
VWQSSRMTMQNLKHPKENIYIHIRLLCRWIFYV